MLSLRAIAKDDKEDLTLLSGDLLKIFSSHWADYTGYQSLEDQTKEFTEEIEQDGDESDKGIMNY